MIKVFITGSNGFIGQELLHQAIRASDIAPVALSKGEDRFAEKEGYLYESIDICDMDEFERLIRLHRPQCVIHTVALANVEECEGNPGRCHSINTKPLADVARLAHKYHFHLIYLSTDFVFDGLEGPYVETDAPRPVNVYGKSKLEAENLIMASNCRWTIIRTILVYGMPRESGRSNFILWVKKSLEENKPIQVVTDHVRMPTLVNDLADVCLAIARNQATGLFHICGEEVYSVNEIARKVARFWNLDESLISDVRSEDLPSTVARPEFTGFDISKAKNMLHFKPHTLLEGLQIVSNSLPEGI